MLIEAALLSRNLLNEGNQIHNFIRYCVCENFCDSILLRFRLRYGRQAR
jgi:hypothetical protein